MDIEEIQQRLGEYLASDFEHGPFSDSPFVRVQVEPDGMLSLYRSGHRDAWPSGSFDVPQLAEWLAPLVKRAQAEATTAELRDLADMFVDQACAGWPHNVDIREVAEHFESMTLQRADRIEKEAGNEPR